MAEQSELDWTVQKASELLADKVKDAPISDRDIDPAFEMSIKPRLEKIPESFTSELEHRRARDLVQERAKRLMPSAGKRRSEKP